MRFDAQGLFWLDEEIVKPERKVQVDKRQPPERVWEHPDYLPDLEEARKFDVVLFTDEELLAACMAKERLVFDIECYTNYFLICLRSLSSHKLVYFEMYEGQPLHLSKLAWVVRNFLLIGFNSRAYDMPMLQWALSGASCQDLKSISDRIILEDVPAWEITKGLEEAPCLKHIDLIEVAPLDCSLKLYGGRLHAPRMWDLPFPPQALLSPEQMLITRWYCVNDLDLTEILYLALKQQIELREKLEEESGLELCSLSDAQIAESTISQELGKRGVKARRVSVAVGQVFKYQAPAFLKFKTEYMQKVLLDVCDFDFVVEEDGYVRTPDGLSGLKVRIGDLDFQMGVGGLHSCEKSIAHIADGTFTLIDRDVASYYPQIILNCRLFPEHLGEVFLDIYQTLVSRRLAAKRAKNRVAADSLKIVVNGTFGKLGSKWSILYSPALMLQVTITGQLSLLMLIEALQQAEIGVVSANTDGVVMKIPAGLETRANQVVNDWEAATGFQTEGTEYSALYSRDVNNYIAIKKEGGAKNKGAFGNPWAEKFPSIFRLHKNPSTTICIEAVEQYLAKGTALKETIQKCTDIRKFTSIRTVRGGAVKSGVYLGKAIRWYYGTDAGGEIIYASTGNKVAKSDGASPLMALPNNLPLDIDYQWYEEECAGMLESFGINLI